MPEPIANGSNGITSAKKKILINAFDMSTVGHLSPGQWKNPKDKSASKRKLDYWIDLAKLLERGGINAVFLADTYGGMADDRSYNCALTKLFKWTSTHQDSQYQQWQL
jgi:hypothetical protein